MWTEYRSVIVDLNVGPPPEDSVNEGDADRTASIIASHSQAGQYIGDYYVSRDDVTMTS